MLHDDIILGADETTSLGGPGLQLYGGKGLEALDALGKGLEDHEEELHDLGPVRAVLQEEDGLVLLAHGDEREGEVLGVHAVAGDRHLVEDVLASVHNGGWSRGYRMID